MLYQKMSLPHTIALNPKMTLLHQDCLALLNHKMLMLHKIRPPLKMKNINTVKMPHKMRPHHKMLVPHMMRLPYKI